MPRINATRAEYARGRAKARRDNAATRARLALPGAWQAERDAAQAALDLAAAQGDERGAIRARNSIIVLRLFQPR